MKGFIVMYGSHGLEINREPITAETLKDVFRQMIEESEIEPGDRFVIEEED